MRKYLFSFAVISSIISGIRIVKSTLNGPRNWRLGMNWLSWVASLGIAIGTVAEKSKNVITVKQKEDPKL